MTATLPKLLRLQSVRWGEFTKELARIRLFTFQHALFLGGLAGIAYGAWLLFHPLGFVVGGWFGIKVSLLIEAERR